jgi:hypothetical protein
MAFLATRAAWHVYLFTFEQACVGSRTRDRGEAGPALVTKAMSHQGKTYARAARDGVGNVRKSRSLLHLTSKE